MPAPPDPTTPVAPPPRPGHTRIFVYGTLKQGCRNHAALAGQTALGPARTVPGYRLYSLGEYPGMLADVTVDTGVIGEVWDVDPTALARLDAFEGVPEGLYQRAPVRLLPPWTDAEVETYLYLRSVEGCRGLGADWQE